jgi:hypothetical protein
MSNRLILPCLTAAFFAAVAMAPSSADAQASFTVDIHDSSAVLREGQVIDLKATITNNDLSPINVRAVRVTNDLPGPLWYTAMCFGEHCYPPDMDIAPPVKLEPGASVEFKLTVATEETSYGLGQVSSRITWDAGEGTPQVTHLFVVDIDGTAAAPGEQTVAARNAWPNPARTSAIIPIEAGVRAENARVQLVDALGRTVVDMRDAATTADGIRIDVANVPDGAYFYRVDIDGTARTGRVVVAH